MSPTSGARPFFTVSPHLTALDYGGGVVDPQHAVPPVSAPAPASAAEPAPSPAPGPEQHRTEVPRVHLDAGGSARLHPQARVALERAYDEGWADPRRLYSEGRRAASLLAGARAAVAEVLAVRPEEVRFAPSHTAALHAAVRAVALGRRRTGTTVVTSAVERAAVLAAAGFVTAGRSPAGAAPAVPVTIDGTGVTDETGDQAAAGHVTVAVDRAGRVDVDAFSAAVASPGVALAALQHSNGEVGTLQPVDAVHAAARAARVPLLVDAGAALGHVAPPRAWDLLAADPADWGGPTGVGILAVRAGVRWRADWPEDEDTWFPGGVSVPAAFAAAVALQACQEDLAAADARRRALVDRIRDRVPALVPDVDVVGDPDGRLPHVVTFSCLYVDGEALVTEFDRAGFAVGSGSACTSSALEPSHVLAAMGALTHGNVRIALDRTVTEDDVERFLAVLPGAVARVRALLGVESL